MADDLRPFPPSDAKLKKLREQGVVPYSHELQIFSVFLGLAVGLLFLLYMRIDLLANGFREMISGQLEPIEVTESAISIFLDCVWPFFLSVFFCIIAIGLIQTRFLLDFSLAKLSFRPPKKLLELSAKHKIVRLVIVSPMLFTMAFLALRRLLELTPSMLEGQLKLGNLLKEANNEAASGLLLLLSFSFSVGLVSRFAAVLSFRAVHGMSRSELEAESREQELSPEIKRQLNYLRDE